MFSSERIRLLHVLNNFKTCQKLVTRVLSRLLLQSVNQLMQTQHSEVVDMLLALIQTRFDYDFLQSYNEVFHDFFFFLIPVAVIDVAYLTVVLQRLKAALQSPSGQSMGIMAMGSSPMVPQKAEQSQLLVQQPDAPSPAQPQVLNVKYKFLTVTCFFSSIQNML